MNFGQNCGSCWTFSCATPPQQPFLSVLFFIKQAIIKVNWSYMKPAQNFDLKNCTFLIEISGWLLTCTRFWISFWTYWLKLSKHTRGVRYSRECDKAACGVAQCALVLESFLEPLRILEQEAHGRDSRTECPSKPFLGLNFEEKIKVTFF